MATFNRRWCFVACHFIPFVCRLGNPKDAKADVKPFAELFSVECANPLLQAYTQILLSLKAGNYLPERIINLALQFVSYRCVHSHYHSCVGLLALPPSQRSDTCLLVHAATTLLACSVACFWSVHACNTWSRPYTTCRRCILIAQLHCMHSHYFSLHIITIHKPILALALFLLSLRPMLKQSVQSVAGLGKEV